MTDAVSIGTTVAHGPLLVAMVAGMISFFIPCCLPLVPGNLAYVTGAAGADAADDVRVQTRSTAVVGTPLFVLGIAAAFTSYGALFETLGGTLIRHQDPPQVAQRAGALLSFARSLGLRVPFSWRPWGSAAPSGLSTSLARMLAPRLRIGGAILVILGVLEVTGIWGTWPASPRTLIGSWQVPL